MIPIYKIGLDWIGIFGSGVYYFTHFCFLGLLSLVYRNRLFSLCYTYLVWSFFLIHEERGVHIPGDNLTCLLCLVEKIYNVLFVL
jgi:hypothetical protein